jgi:hypothetical protein
LGFRGLKEKKGKDSLHTHRIHGIHFERDEINHDKMPREMNFLHEKLQLEGILVIKNS